MQKLIVNLRILQIINIGKVPEVFIKIRDAFGTEYGKLLDLFAFENLEHLREGGSPDMADKWAANAMFIAYPDIFYAAFRTCERNLKYYN